MIRIRLRSFIIALAGLTATAFIGPDHPRTSSVATIQTGKNLKPKQLPAATLTVVKGTTKGKAIKAGKQLTKPSAKREAAKKKSDLVLYDEKIRAERAGESAPKYSVEEYKNIMVQAFGSPKKTFLRPALLGDIRRASPSERAKIAAALDSLQKTHPAIAAQISQMIAPVKEAGKHTPT